MDEDTKNDILLLKMIYSHILNKSNLLENQIHPIFLNNIIPNNVIQKWKTIFEEDILKTNKIHTHICSLEYILTNAKLISTIKTEFKKYEQDFFNNLYIIKDINSYILNKINFNENIYIENWHNICDSNYEFIFYYDNNNDEFIHIDIAGRTSFFKLTEIEINEIFNDEYNKEYNTPTYIKLEAYCNINNIIINGIYYIIKYKDLVAKKEYYTKLKNIQHKYNTLLNKVNRLSINAEY